MASGNRFGEHFCISSFGESHGVSVGVVVDGCPSGLDLQDSDIQAWLNRRRPGQSAYVSPRPEKDIVKILSGVYEGRTTGAPIAMIIQNEAARTVDYEAVQGLLRPGHANFSYWKKWEHYDPRGGGRASARETVARVCGGAIASKILEKKSISIVAFVRQIGHLRAQQIPTILSSELIQQSLMRCPDPEVSEQMKRYLENLQQEGDSIGGVVETWIDGLPSGLGSPVFDRFDARLSYAMMSLPAARAFSMDDGFECAIRKGSEFNDSFAKQGSEVAPTSNHANGVMAGITTGQRLRLQVAFKPASSIRKPQTTCDHDGREGILDWTDGFRHDPTVVIRACPVVEAMIALVCIDFLMDRPCDQINTF